MTVDLDDLKAARERIGDKVTYTPLLESAFLNEKLDGRVLFKAECLQKTGSFKIRGAISKLSTLTQSEKQQGVIAFSSGNHAQGVAAAARMYGVSAKIVIPEDAPQLKIDNTRSYGAEVVLYDRYNQDREAIARQIQAKEGRILIPPFDDEKIIAGQGTIGLEIVDQLSALNLKPDLLLCPCGGGGLIAGIATAISSYYSDAHLYAVEPENFDDTARSFQAGTILANNTNSRSICDSIVTDRPGEKTFNINKKLLTGILTVTDQQVVNSMKQAFTQLKLVVEPGGVVGLAALLSKSISLKQQTAVVILSGGNIDSETYFRLIKC